MKSRIVMLVVLALLLLAGCQTGDQETPAATSPAATAGADSGQPPAPPEPQDTAAPEDVTIEASDGLAIQATFYPASATGRAPGVMLLHMNGGQRQDWDQIAPQLAKAGYAVLAVDMRGHGETGGSSDWQQTPDDLQQVWAYFTGRKDVDPERTAIVGASIGSSMALLAAVAEPAIRTVVLLSPGLNYFNVTTDDAITAYGERPVLIVASEEDTESAESARTLSELALGEVQLEMVQGAGHGTAMFDAQPELLDLILAWLDAHLKGETGPQSEEAATPEPAGDTGLPAPTLFDMAWDDRSLFRDGLVEAEAGILEQLPGASVYHLDVTVADDLRTVAGRLEVRYANQEEVALDAVYFHLFPNVLGGNIAVSDVTVNGAAAEPSYEEQETILRVPLAVPLAPGQQAVISLAFDVGVPTEGGSNYGVFAVVDEVLALAHFYPLISVYDDGGWNIAPPPANADVVYADSSFYLARLTVPAGQVVVASGRAIDSQSSGDTQTLTYASGPTRDFYVASSAHYEVASQTVGQTTVNSYGFPEFIERTEETLGYAVAALQIFNDRLGVYPFTEFDVAATPNLALGVEYPGVVVINSLLYDPEELFGNTPSGFFLESTVAHEVAHQWFYSIVGNDQLDDPWLDESLVQYMTYLYHLDIYGQSGAEGFRQSLFSRWDRVERAEIPIGLPAGEYDGAEYSAIVYGRGPLFFEALAEAMGEEAFSAFLRDYYQSQKWDLGTPEELKALAESHCNCDLTDLFAEWVGEF
ncbi:MAG: alpha/beta fold hydrolase [Chloroflexi bacterium]|nr:alpha/beta fold hydrolase [Chloroflexota bacterium]MCI0577428.1 alpha/beta fold hydrolase [Chloroflexota bacterium]MCI0649484.1 alpha/beta fold hydrolase [Chloroflexota bacterium]MCI0725354.1 alpha/beta fold hydrolase [Chloroflexota bacterium]